MKYHSKENPVTGKWSYVIVDSDGYFVDASEAIYDNMTTVQVAAARRVSEVSKPKVKS